MFGLLKTITNYLFGLSDATNAVLPNNDMQAGISESVPLRSSTPVSPQIAGQSAARSDDTRNAVVAVSATRPIVHSSISQTSNANEERDARNQLTQTTASRHTPSQTRRQYNSRRGNSTGSPSVSPYTSAAVGRQSWSSPSPVTSSSALVSARYLSSDVSDTTIAIHKVQRVERAEGSTKRKESKNTLVVLPSSPIQSGSLRGSHPKASITSPCSPPSIPASRRHDAASPTSASPSTPSLSFGTASPPSSPATPGRQQLTATRQRTDDGSHSGSKKRPLESRSASEAGDETCSIRQRRRSTELSSTWSKKGHAHLKAVTENEQGFGKKEKRRRLSVATAREEGEGGTPMKRAKPSVEIAPINKGKKRKHSEELPQSMESNSSKRSRVLPQPTSSSVSSELIETPPPSTPSESHNTSPDFEALQCHSIAMLRVPVISSAKLPLPKTWAAKRWEPARRRMTPELPPETPVAGSFHSETSTSLSEVAATQGAEPSTASSDACIPPRLPTAVAASQTQPPGSSVPLVPSPDSSTPTFQVVEPLATSFASLNSTALSSTYPTLVGNPLGNRYFGDQESSSQPAGGSPELGFAAPTPFLALDMDLGPVCTSRPRGKAASLQRLAARRRKSNWTARQHGNALAAQVGASEMIVDDEHSSESSDDAMQIDHSDEAPHCASQAVMNISSIAPAGSFAVFTNMYGGTSTSFGSPFPVAPSQHLSGNLSTSMNEASATAVVPEDIDMSSMDDMPTPFVAAGTEQSEQARRYIPTPAFAGGLPTFLQSASTFASTSISSKPYTADVQKPSSLKYGYPDEPYSMPASTGSFQAVNAAHHLAESRRALEAERERCLLSHHPLPVETSWNAWQENSSPYFPFASALAESSASANQTPPPPPCEVQGTSIPSSSINHAHSPSVGDLPAPRYDWQGTLITSSDTAAPSSSSQPTGTSQAGSSSAARKGNSKSLLQKKTGTVASSSPTTRDKGKNKEESPRIFRPCPKR